MADAAESKDDPCTVTMAGKQYPSLMGKDAKARGKYDAIILGTGIQSCLLGLCLAQAKKKVLQVDREKFYGGEGASLALDEFYQKFMGPDGYKKEWEKPVAEGGRGFGRAFNYQIDLCPKFIMAQGDMVKLLIHALGVDRVCGRDDHLGRGRRHVIVSSRGVVLPVVTSRGAAGAEVEEDVEGVRLERVSGIHGGVEGCERGGEVALGARDVDLPPGLLPGLGGEVLRAVGAGACVVSGGWMGGWVGSVRARWCVGGGAAAVGAGADRRHHGDSLPPPRSRAPAGLGIDTDLLALTVLIAVDPVAVVAFLSDVRHGACDGRPRVGAMNE